ncbi:MAG: hypothetical protein WA435_06325 [Gallionellaceae bacterium]
MRLPRDLTGAELVGHPARLGYRQNTPDWQPCLRDMRYSTSTSRYTVPLHDPLRIGTLSAILGDGPKRKESSVMCCWDGCLASFEFCIT